MLAHLKGTVSSRSDSGAVLDVNGVGYEVHMAQATAAALPETGQQVKLLISESTGIYGGVSLYAFLAEEERSLFELFKDAVPNTGAKKALEYLNKALRSLPDFHAAITSKNTRLLTGIFGFTAKTAEKLSVALKDRMPLSSFPGSALICRQTGGGTVPGGAYAQALNALSALGYRYAEARAALQGVQDEDSAGPDEKVEELLRRALRRLVT
ncbi:MAG: Holliday junction branch migration protein RuvA [bacterium]